MKKRVYGLNLDSPSGRWRREPREKRVCARRRWYCRILLATLVEWNVVRPFSFAETLHHPIASVSDEHILR